MENVKDGFIPLLDIAMKYELKLDSDNNLLKDNIVIANINDLEAITINDRTYINEDKFIKLYHEAGF